MPKNLITNALGEIADENNVCILLAVEAGSRAWGFASPDSDYDVRHVFCRSTEDYLSIINIPPDHLSPGPVNIDGTDFDYAGWDIRKALTLLSKGNAALYEWCMSGIVYSNNFGFRDAAIELYKLGNPVYKFKCHHQSLIKSSMSHKDINGTIPIKKFMYALRSAMSIEFMEAEKRLPPIKYEELAESVFGRIISRKCMDLLDIKRNSNEKARINLGDYSYLRNFVIGKLSCKNTALLSHHKEVDPNLYNSYLRKVMKEAQYFVWGEHRGWSKEN